MVEEKTLRDEISELKDIVLEDKEKQKKPKKFRLPARAKIKKSKLKKGYITIAKIEDNMNVDFVREPIIDGTIKLDGDTFHAVEDFDIFNYKGKPFIFQCKSKINPFNPFNPLAGDHQTYGQKYVMARMEGDKIVNKKKIGGWGITIGGLIIGAVIIYALITGG